MRALVVCCLLFLPCTFGALLGGYRAVDIDDQTVRSKLRPLLGSSGNLGILPIRRLLEQKLYKVTNYKVYQGIPNNKGSELCKRITCPDNEECLPPVPCKRKDTTRTGRTLLGGHKSVPLEEAQDAIDFVMEKMNSMSNSLFRFVTEDVTNLTKQVIAGYRYQFTISLVSTICRNNGDNVGKQLGDCELTDNPERQKCHVSVLNTLTNGHWEYSLESHQCDPITSGSDSHQLSEEELANCRTGFQQFKKDFKRGYSSSKEENYRFEAFCTNMKRIEKMKKIEQGSATYGINKFADMSEEEFRMYFLTPKWNLAPQARPWMTPAKPVNIREEDIPDNFDWRKKGAVTPVKNQGNCGSCWAFSTTGNIEGQWAISSKKLVSLSEQELVDCDKLDDGCNGGLPSNAYEAIIKLGGVETEKDYKYSGRDGTCTFNRSEVAVKISGGLNISSDETEMKAWLFKNGPISIGINANAMQFYMGGISYPWRIFCNPSSLDHGVLIVGYGVSSGNKPYWIIKNSWGADWGVKGYYLVYRGKGVCGLNKMCTSAKIN